MLLSSQAWLGAPIRPRIDYLGHNPPIICHVDTFMACLANPMRTTLPSRHCGQGRAAWHGRCGIILGQTRRDEQREFYVLEAIGSGWPKRELDRQIRTRTSRPRIDYLGHNLRLIWHFGFSALVISSEPKCAREET